MELVSGTRLKLLGDRVLIRFFKWRSETFLTIPDKWQHQPVEGVIIGLGPKADHALSIGQKVIATRMDGEYIQCGDERYCIMPSSGIVGIDFDHPVNSERPILEPQEAVA